MCVYVCHEGTYIVRVVSAHRSERNDDCSTLYTHTHTHTHTHNTCRRAVRSLVVVSVRVSGRCVCVHPLVRMCKASLPWLQGARSQARPSRTVDTLCHAVWPPPCIYDTHTHTHVGATPWVQPTTIAGPCQYHACVCVCVCVCVYLAPPGKSNTCTAHTQHTTNMRPCLHVYYTGLVHRALSVWTWHVCYDDVCYGVCEGTCVDRARECVMMRTFSLLFRSLRRCTHAHHTHTHTTYTLCIDAGRRCFHEAPCAHVLS